MKNIYEATASNKRKSVIVVVSFFLFFGLVIYIFTNLIGLYIGYEPGGLGFVGMALIFSGITSFISYYASDKIVLAISQARPADRKREFDFYTVVENLCLGANLPKPKLYVIEDSATNAFATGRDPDHSVICATTGLLEKLDRTQLESVMAHELSHIKYYDTRLMSIVAVMVGTVALLGDWLVRIRWRGKRGSDKSSQLGALFLFFGVIFALLSPIIAQLIQLAISRRREFVADVGSVSITRQPTGLIEALGIISADHEPLEAANKATAHLYIANPFKDKAKSAVGWFSGLFNTHPPVAERVKALKQMI
jgi:heat shock protein HtpX